MRPYSTTASVEKGHASVLALLETVIAVSLSVWIAVQYGTTRWIAITASFAPLALLRTDYSVELGLRLGKHLWNCCEAVKDAVLVEIVQDDHEDGCDGLIFLVFSMFLFLVGLLVMPLIRIVATSVAILRHPIASIVSIPKNWYRYVACIDTAYVPEPLPGCVQTYPDDFLTFQRLGKLTSRWRFDLILPLCLMVSVWCLPSLIFRWSMKSTAFVYSPLLWVVGYTSRKMDRLDRGLYRIYRSPVSVLVIAYSVAIIFAFLVKCTLMTCYNTFTEQWNATELARFLSVYIVPHEIPLWQLAAFINAILALVLFYCVGLSLLRIRTHEPWPEPVVRSVLRSMTFIRCVLTLYTVACTLYITIRAADYWQLPKLGNKLFPWS